MMSVSRLVCEGALMPSSSLPQYFVEGWEPFSVLAEDMHMWWQSKQTTCTLHFDSTAIAMMRVSRSFTILHSIELKSELKSHRLSVRAQRRCFPRGGAVASFTISAREMNALKERPF